MSYLAAEALQSAVYQHLRGDDALGAIIGDAIYDAMPAVAPPGVFVSLGPEEVRDVSDMTAGGAQHDFVVSVLAGTDEIAGFRAVKSAAVAVAGALDGADLVPDFGRVVGLWFLKAKARRSEAGAGRRVDLTFRARIDLG